ncbi:MAG: glycoside hydrolase family 15 protein [Dehalogenimonas sp.]|uniref:Glycoside hydrolase family 15 protein n=1 Tax=Candidatus Dehalogenimonas loeffleri TaxID=3127115 RepID=A0ABZ2J9K0_9CHLR|nr:glycoside hydrolase family 15 protein [Dehalogenimonas sp.]
MTEIRQGTAAFGHPGLPPNWTEGAKEGVGTAYNSLSRVWFTLAGGIITEVYYPTIDRPQVRDLTLLITDGETFFQAENTHLFTETRTNSPTSLSYQIINSDPDGRYAITKNVIADPSSACVLQNVRLAGAPDFLSRLRLYVQCAPHLNVSGWHNNGMVIESAGRTMLAAEKDGVWMVLGANIPFKRVSCGYSGVSDGWTDISDNFQMDWEYAEARDGNIALTAELDFNPKADFTLGLALGDSLQHAVTNLFQALALPFKDRQKIYDQQWQQRNTALRKLGEYSGDTGNLYHAGTSLLAAHEDKTYPGAFIASLAIPWGTSRGGDEEAGGYHLVWTRDLVNSVTGLLAAGDSEAARRALIYLAAAQHSDGNFPQNFWLDGQPYWEGVQLDEVAFPIILARKLHQSGIKSDFDDYEIVKRAAGFLVNYGPATQQERWEENSGYSPSTLASNIAALICAAAFCREKDDTATAEFLEDYADFLESHLEKWTVTNQGTLVCNLPRHYIRINPVAIDDPHPDDSPDNKILTIRNHPSGEKSEFEAPDIVDAGFLELVRYGIRRPDDQLIEDSLKVVDAVLKTQTPFGPVWRRYNHDGYGQRLDGSDYQGWGFGHGWPLLTGERAHYELAAGRDITSYLEALEGFSSYTGLLPEQVWIKDDLTEAGMYLGRPTGAAMPLIWAHAEYIKLLRSKADGVIFDLIPEVAARYLTDRKSAGCHEVWKFNYRPQHVKPGERLRIQTQAAFRLVWTMNDWQTVNQDDAVATAVGIYYVDLIAVNDSVSPIRFTFYWTASEHWEGRDFEVAISS